MVWELLELVEKAWECVFGAWCFISSTLWMRMMFLEKNSFASDVIWTANEFGSAFDVDEFEVNFVVVFQTHVHAFFNNNSNWNFVFPSCILFLEAVRMFEDVFWTFLEFVNKMRMDNVYFWNVMVNSNILNSPNMMVRSLRRTFIFVHAAAATSTARNSWNRRRPNYACCTCKTT